MAKKKVAKKTAEENVERALVIGEPNFRRRIFRLYGASPYVQNAFGNKAVVILERQTESTAKSRSKSPRDVDSDYEGAFHRLPDGSQGMPASAFRNAMISACRVAGYVMTRAKLGVFIEADGFDVTDGTPLVRFKGTPERHMSHVRIQNTTSVVVRPMWREWTCDLRVRYDGDQFQEQDIANLLMRVGCQVGIGEGRPDSRTSCGMGWGLFSLTPPTK